MQRFWQGLNGHRRLLQELLAAARAKPTHVAEPRPGEVAQRLLLGDTPVELRVRQTGPAGLRLLSLHENEQTAVAAAGALLQRRPGTLIELRSRGRRLVSFRDGLRPFAFDPNRIFSDAGIALTLRRHGSLTPAAEAAVRRLRDAVLALIDGHPDEPVVALHNNRAGRYSVLQYQPGGDHVGDAGAVAVQPGHAPQDFFVVTRAALFERLRDAGFNVVLQSDQPADDGSLSVWFQQQRRAYVNVEARHGHLREQQRMLEAVAALAPR